ncbi:DUF461 domain-containing protein [Streptomyces peucetius]|uniref:DUF461 domain-containing protein n=1 Tax=Streptomyces peucetius TaxID=1950 RepID=A0ABY6IAH9_STRPE|nr:DUF461 domain-containing protein [Streptomyces peucetius]UYQ62947.1 DUF461 domain-containing protein [Streptomyces peucetius]
MSSSLRRGALAGAAIVFSIASLSACGAGNDAQTLGVRPDNAATTVDSLKLQNVTVITQPKPDTEGPAAVSLTIFNEGSKPQTLESIELPGSRATVKLNPADGSGAITVPAQGSVVIGGEGNASAVIENGNKEINHGVVREVVFRFSETGDVPVRAQVFPATNYFRSWGPSELPSPPAQSPSGSPSASPTDSPAGTETAPADTEAAGGEGEAAPSDAASASHSAGH